MPIRDQAVHLHPIIVFGMTSFFGVLVALWVVQIVAACSSNDVEEPRAAEAEYRDAFAPGHVLGEDRATQAEIPITSAFIHSQ